MAETSSPARLRLAGSLDAGSAPALLGELLSLRGRPLEIDAGGVERSSTLCMQVLVVAAAAWRKAGCPFHVANPSPRFAEAASLLGISPDQLLVDCVLP